MTLYYLVHALPVLFMNTLRPEKSRHRKRFIMFTFFRIWLLCSNYEVKEDCSRSTHTLYSNPTTGLEGPWGFQKDEAPRFQDNRHIKVVRLSALRTGHLYLTSVRVWVQVHSAAGRFMKNSNDTIENRTCDLPVCSTVSQPTAPTRAPNMHVEGKKK